MGFKRKKLDDKAEDKLAEKIEDSSGVRRDIAEFQDREELKESTSSGEDGARSCDTASGRKMTRFRIFLLLAIAFCLFVSAAGFLFIKFKTHSWPFTDTVQKLEPVTAIMRPIPQPDYREMLDFLLVYEVEGQKMVTAMRMEVGYQSPTRYQNFKEQKVALRDAVYAFLLKQNPSGNSVQSWHSVVEKELLDFLRVKLPQSCPDKIALTQVENL